MGKDDFRTLNHTNSDLLALLGRSIRVMCQLSQFNVHILEDRRRLAILDRTGDKHVLALIN